MRKKNPTQFIFSNRQAFNRNTHSAGVWSEVRFASVLGHTLRKQLKERVATIGRIAPPNTQHVQLWSSLLQGWSLIYKVAIDSLWKIANQCFVLKEICQNLANCRESTVKGNFTFWREGYLSSCLVATKRSEPLMWPSRFYICNVERSRRRGRYVSYV